MIYRFRFLRDQNWKQPYYSSNHFPLKGKVYLNLLARGSGGDIVLMRQDRDVKFCLMLAWFTEIVSVFKYVTNSKPASGDCYFGLFKWTGMVCPFYLYRKAYNQLLNRNFFENLKLKHDRKLVYVLIFFKKLSSTQSCLL